MTRTGAATPQKLIGLPFGADGDIDCKVCGLSFLRLSCTYLAYPVLVLQLPFICPG